MSSVSSVLRVLREEGFRQKDRGCDLHAAPRRRLLSADHGVRTEDTETRKELGLGKSLFADEGKIFQDEFRVLVTRVLRRRVFDK